jgi:hypothetical protein
VGISVFNNKEVEAWLRQKLKSDTGSLYVSIFCLTKESISTKLTRFYSTLIACYNYLKFFGPDNINMDASTTGERCRLKWIFRCRFFVPAILNYADGVP